MESKTQFEVTVVDAIMGTGKTTWAINYMKANKDEDFIFITPYIEETERIRNESLPERDFILPRRTGPDSGKLDNFIQHISYGDDIASTHELFKRFNERTKSKLTNSPGRYTLIIDETLDVVVPVNIKTSDIKLCIEKGLIKINEDGVCEWVYDVAHYDGVLEDVKQIAETGNMVCVKDTFFLWRLDPEIFNPLYFSKVIVLTYLFDGSVMKAYFDYYGISYEKVSIREGQIVPYYEPDITEIAKLVNLYKGPLNDSFEQKPSSLSATWYKDRNNEKEISRLRKNMDNYFKNIIKASADKILWSTFLSPTSTERHFKSAFGETRYDAHFVSCNVKGTNKYANCNTVAYMINVFLNPGIQHFFAQRDLKVNASLYALQYMLQWIWRSCIRNNKPINIYVPSDRMRRLFKCWLENKNIN